MTAPKEVIEAKQIFRTESISSVEHRRNAVDEVAQAVCVDRNASYGTPEDNFNNIARLWNEYLAIKYGFVASLCGMDVALLMDLMKTARLINNPTHRDSWIDKAGYSICGVGIVETNRKEG
jgi:hypothetical protein